MEGSGQVLLVGDGGGRSAKIRSSHTLWGLGGILLGLRKHVKIKCKIFLRTGF